MDTIQVIKPFNKWIVKICCKKSDEDFELIEAVLDESPSLSFVTKLIMQRGKWECLTSYEWCDIFQYFSAGYDSIVSAIVRARYTSDDVEAIVNNLLADPSEEHKAEFAELQQWREKAKATAKEVINIINSELYDNK